MENYEIKIAFLGTGEFGTKILQGLIKGGYKPTTVYDSEKIEELKPDLVIVASYGKLIPKKILKIPKYGSINVHPSLLPKYRGPSPIQTAILNGDKTTGVSIMLMDEKIDHGKIIDQQKYQIPQNIGYKELETILANQGAKLLIKAIPRWIAGEIKAKEQNHSEATETKIIKKQDGKIDWDKTAEEIERQIRAFDPWPGTFTFWKGNIIKILAGQAVKVVPKNKFAIKCKKDYLIIKRLQPAGKKPMGIDDFLRGHHDFNPLL